MKIKAVCDETRLTDRTIRYYIEEHLISPAYTENYLGRKSFEFSQEDIDTLKNISILRKFNFTIEEIRRIITDIYASADVISNVRQRTAQEISIGEEKLRVLSSLQDGQLYTLQQLAEELSRPQIVQTEYEETAKRNLVSVIRSCIKSVLLFAIVWTPILLCIWVFIGKIAAFYYPVFNFGMIGWTIASLWPSLGVLTISRTRWKQNNVLKRILLALCVMSIPVSFILSIFTITESETTDISNYRYLDVGCLANNDSFYQELFPRRANRFESVQLSDGHTDFAELEGVEYYYRYIKVVDYTYDVYAQWPLEKGEFEEEVARVQALYERRATENGNEYVVVRKGSYTCLISYKVYGKEKGLFEEVSDSYSYYIFAYDEESMMVRYIVCDSLENGADQPYYLSLEWE